VSLGLDFTRDAWWGSRAGPARYIGRGKILEWIMPARDIEAFIKKRPAEFRHKPQGNE